MTAPLIQAILPFIPYVLLFLLFMHIFSKLSERSPTERLNEDLAGIEPFNPKKETWVKAATVAIIVGTLLIFLWRVKK